MWFFWFLLTPLATTAVYLKSWITTLTILSCIHMYVKSVTVSNMETTAGCVLIMSLVNMYVHLICCMSTWLPKLQFMCCCSKWNLHANQNSWKNVYLIYTIWICNISHLPASCCLQVLLKLSHIVFLVILTGTNGRR